MTLHEPTAAPDSGRRRRRAWGSAAAALVLVGTGCFVAWSSQPSEAPQSPPAQSAPVAEAAPVREAPVAEKRSPEPTFIRVPSIGVATPLIQLGLQEDDTVEVPEQAEDAGWFDLGTRPGDVGSAVILGHVDSVEGPAVFARLKELTPRRARRGRRC